MRGDTLTFSEGGLVYSPFEPKKEVFLIEFGYVIAFTYEDSGKRRIHLIYGPGSYFPVITTFKNTEQRASYEALTKLVIKRYQRTEFMKLLKSDIEFSNSILSKTVDQLAIFADIVVNLQVTKLEEKLLGRLINMAKAHGVESQQGSVLPYKLKHYHLADMLGVERESVSRVLQSLKKKQLIDINKQGHIVIRSKL